MYTFEQQPPLCQYNSYASSSLTNFQLSLFLPVISSPVFFQPSSTSTSPSGSPASYFLRSFEVLQWNAGCLCATSVEFLRFLSLFPSNFIGIQESNLISFLSLLISRYCALRPDHTRFNQALFHLMTRAPTAMYLFS